MEPTIVSGDRCIVDLRAYKNKGPGKGEIAVYLRNSIYFEKRVIATGGDSILSTDNVVTLNGVQIEEAYIIHKNKESSPDWLKNFGPVEVPPGKFFLMGDNRDVSLDSRANEVGLIDSSELVGRAVYVYRPEFKPL